MSYSIAADFENFVNALKPSLDNEKLVLFYSYLQ